jgi:hypothetical protein
MRVPLRSSIARVFESGKSTVEVEDMNWWTSSGKSLAGRRVQVCVERNRDNSVVALLVEVAQRGL